MAYEVHVNHPETWQRREESFAAWSFWAPKNAPWTGVGINQMASILERACTEVSTEVCRILDKGGDLDANATRTVLKAAEHEMTPATREVFARAVQDGYGVRVIFSKSLGTAVSASAYLEKHGSA